LNWICEQVGQNAWWQMCIRFAQELPYVDVTPILERVSVLSSD